MNPVLAKTVRSLQRNILAGLITIGPLFVTWLVFSFLFKTLAQAGLPPVSYTHLERNWFAVAG